MTQQKGQEYSSGILAHHNGLHHGPKSFDTGVLGELYVFTALTKLTQDFSKKTQFL